jgi:hypothetical protein
MMLKLIYEFYDKLYDIVFRYNIPMHMIIYHHGEVNTILRRIFQLVWFEIKNKTDRVLG